ncbi:MAG: RidA family protein, partial [Candidatus Sulfotelmatobacter sp.]
MKTVVIGLLFWCAVGMQAQTGAKAPSQESSDLHRATPSSVNAGDYIYFSAQGPRGVDGTLPATFAAQARQALTHLKSAVEAAGLTMDHVVYTT